MFADVVEFLIVLGMLSPAIAVAVYVSKPGKGGRLENLILFYLFVSLFFDILCYVLATYYVENNLIIAHFYEIAATLPLALIYAHQQKELFWKRVVLISFGLLTLLGLLYFTVADLWNSSSGYFYMAVAALASLFSLRYFLKVIKTPEFKYITNDPNFWVNSAFLFFFGSAVFLSLFEVVIFSDIDYFVQIYTPVHLLTYLLSNLALAVALWKTW